MIHPPSFCLLASLDLVFYSNMVSETSAAFHSRWSPSFIFGEDNLHPTSVHHNSSAHHHHLNQPRLASSPLNPQNVINRVARNHSTHPHVPPEEPRMRSIFTCIPHAHSCANSISPRHDSHTSAPCHLPHQRRVICHITTMLVPHHSHVSASTLPYQHLTTSAPCHVNIYRHVSPCCHVIPAAMSTLPPRQPYCTICCFFSIFSILRLFSKKIKV